MKRKGNDAGLEEEPLFRPRSSFFLSSLSIPFHLNNQTYIQPLFHLLVLFISLLTFRIGAKTPRSQTLIPFPRVPIPLPYFFFGGGASGNLLRLRLLVEICVGYLCMEYWSEEWFCGEGGVKAEKEERCSKAYRRDPHRLEYLAKDKGDQGCMNPCRANLK